MSDWSSDVCSSDLTAVVTESTYIYFARQQVADRPRVAAESLPEGTVPTMGPIATGLGEVYMWTVQFRHRAEDTHKPGEPGLQPDGSYITPDGERLVTDAHNATWLRTAPDRLHTPPPSNTTGLAGLHTLAGASHDLPVVPTTPHPPPPR